jgi:phenylpropionate dioxygenase-like ring-hydroxylating dioxygenase large terminal subunit
MGTLMRQYWAPVFMSSELPSPDCPPQRVRILGENLIGFRTTSGDVGLVANACPHRGASMFFGRNEEEGLRCVYHGWKFDVTGACVDMPSEPAESNFKNKVRTRAYPTSERNGIIWAYMGPREVPPPLPDLEANMIEGSNVSTVQRRCNWMQALEGDIDTIHFMFLHYGQLKAEDTYEGGFFRSQVDSRGGYFSVLEYITRDPYDALLRLDQPGPGIAALGTFGFPGGGPTMVAMNFYLYGDQAAATVARETPLWQAWLQERFPMPAEPSMSEGD